MALLLFVLLCGGSGLFVVGILLLLALAFKKPKETEETTEVTEVRSYEERLASIGARIAVDVRFDTPDRFEIYKDYTFNQHTLKDGSKIYRIMDLDLGDTGIEVDSIELARAAVDIYEVEHYEQIKQAKKARAKQIDPILNVRFVK